MDEHIVPHTQARALRKNARPEPNCCPPHVSELVKNWAEVAAFAVAAIWAVWNFWFKEILQPRQVPVNISLNLEMQKVALGAPAPGATPLMAIELSIKATNPSSRVVYLLTSAWMARGYHVQAVPARGDFFALAGASIAANKIRPVEKYASQSNSETVAAGRLFEDDELKPGETITRRIVFHLPSRPYNVVEVFTCVPSTSEPQGIGIVWRFEGDALHWQITRNGKEIPERKPDDKPSNVFQQSFSRAGMSL